jgi:hypothetical protein
MRRILPILLIIACSGKDPVKEDLVPQSQTQPVVDKFYSEASKRGKSIPVINPKFIYSDIKEHNCSTNQYPSLCISHKTGDTYVIELSSNLKVQQNLGVVEVPIIRELMHLSTGTPYASQDPERLFYNNNQSLVIMNPCVTGYNGASEEYAFDYLFH